MGNSLRRAAMVLEQTFLHSYAGQENYTSKK